MRMYLDEKQAKTRAIGSAGLEAIGAASALALVGAALWLMFASMMETRALRELALAAPI